MVHFALLQDETVVVELPSGLFWKGNFKDYWGYVTQIQQVMGKMMKVLMDHPYTKDRVFDVKSLGEGRYSLVESDNPFCAYWTCIIVDQELRRAGFTRKDMKILNEEEDDFFGED